MAGLMHVEIYAFLRSTDRKLIISEEFANKI